MTDHYEWEVFGIDIYLRRERPTLNDFELGIEVRTDTIGGKVYDRNLIIYFILGRLSINKEYY